MFHNRNQQCRMYSRLYSNILPGVSSVGQHFSVIACRAVWPTGPGESWLAATAILHVWGSWLIHSVKTTHPPPPPPPLCCAYTPCPQEATCSMSVCVCVGVAEHHAKEAALWLDGSWCIRIILCIFTCSPYAFMPLVILKILHDCNANKLCALQPGVSGIAAS